MSVAVREVVLVFWAALKPNGPPPVPLAPDVMVSQVAGLVAVQAQPDVVVTVPLAEPPDAVNDRVVGDTEKEQGAPAWVTVTTFPAMVSAPDRDVVEALAEAEKVTEPLPLPLPPLADRQPAGGAGGDPGAPAHGGDRHGPAVRGRGYRLRRRRNRIGTGRARLRDERRLSANCDRRVAGGGRRVRIGGERHVARSRAGVAHGDPHPCRVAVRRPRAAVGCRDADAAGFRRPRQPLGPRARGRPSRRARSA